MNRTPRELLAVTDAAEIAELFAYHSLLNDEREAERDQAAIASWGDPE